MTTLSSPGIGSGLDIAGIVNKLVSAEGGPAASRLDRLESRLQARLSGLGTLKGALSDFQSKLSNLSTLDSFRGRAISNSNDKAFTATANSSAATGNYAVNVATLAQSQTLVTDVSSPYVNTTDVVGTGTLTFRFGNGPIAGFIPDTQKGVYTITIDSSNNTLQGISNAINDADIGVQASIINNGSGYLLSLTSEKTGASNSMEITVSDTGDANDTDTLGLSRLAYNNLATNMGETATAQDAALTINGVSIVSESNDINGAIEGVNMNLLDAQSGVLAVSLDKSGVKTTVNDFVNSYNSLMATVKELTGYDPDTRVAGILNGDAGARAIVSKIRGIISNSVDVLAGGPFTSLPGLGITSQANGSLSINDSKLQEALDNNFDDVATLFSAIGQPSDQLVKYISSTTDSLAGNYDVTVNSLASQGYINGSTSALLADDGLGTFTSAFVIDANNDEFTIKVDGITSNAINLTQKSYTTAAELVAEIQARINSDNKLEAEGVSVAVSFDTSLDRLVMTSSRYGSASAVSFVAVDINAVAELGFDTALVGIDGADVTGTIGGVSATGNGQFLTGNGNATGIKLEITGGSVGSRGTVNFSRGIADQLSTYISEYMDNDVIGDRVDGIKRSVDDIENQREILSRRLEALEKRLQAKFSALDSLVNQLQNTGSFLTQQLDKIGTITVSRNK